MTDRKIIPIWQVDAFAASAFKGNPAAVCFLDDYPDDRWLQNVAVEMNLSETAFVVPTEEPDSFRLRWFTPAAEVDLCGHATLASAHTLIQQKRIELGVPIRFQTRSGELPCHQSGDRITLDFPATPITDDVSEEIASEALASLHVDLGTVLQSRFDTVVVLDDEESVRRLQPDFHRMKQIPTRGVIATAPSDSTGIDFVSRFFAPQHNIDEDPVTGSAHCGLTPYWAERLQKNVLVGYQASARGGTVYCEQLGDRVLLSGTAVTVMEGHLRFD